MTKALGISIGEKYLRFAFVGKENDEIRIIRLEEFEHKGFESLSSDRHLAESIRKFLREAHIHEPVVVSIPDSKVTVRTKTIPPVKEKDIFELIKTEIKDYAIFMNENVLLSFNFSKSDRTSIVWAGITESTFRQIQKFMKNCGIKIKAVTPSNFGLCEAVLSVIGEHEPCGIIKVNKDSTTISFINEGALALSYKQDLGTITLQEAESSERNTWVGNIMTSVTYATRNLAIGVREILLTGEEGDCSQAQAMLLQRLPVPVILLSLPDRVAVENEEDFARVYISGANQFFESIGLALLSTESKQNPLFINLLEYTMREKVSVRLQVVAALIVFAVVNTAACVAYPAVYEIYRKSETQLEAAMTNLKEIKEPASDAERLSKELQNLQSELGSLKNAQQVVKGKFSTSDIMKELMQKSPAGLTIETLDVLSDGTITFTGNTDSYETVLKLLENLSKSKSVTNASIGAMRLNKGVVTFEMKAHVPEVKK